MFPVSICFHMIPYVSICFHMIHRDSLIFHSQFSVMHTGNRWFPRLGRSPSVAKVATCRWPRKCGKPPKSKDRFPSGAAGRGLGGWVKQCLWRFSWFQLIQIILVFFYNTGNANSGRLIMISQIERDWPFCEMIPSKHDMMIHDVT